MSITSSAEDASSGHAEHQATVEIDHVTKHFGDDVAVDDANFAIEEGEFFSMLGPSGCGKTTTLRMIAGFETPTSGAIRLHGRDVSRVPPHKRDVNTVFQHYGLFPHMNVSENIAYGPKAKKVPKDETLRRVAEMLEVVRLSDFATRRPGQLSGGQQQRVALARALVNYPKALLLDEPLGALDLKLRQSMQLELKRIQREVGITFIFVTHDQEEALTMSDRIAVMNHGRVEQLGTPEELYERPTTRFVADFIGTTNLVSGTVVGREGGATTVRLGGGELARTAMNGLQPGATVELCIRPESIDLVPAAAAGALSARVEHAAYLGTTIQYQVRTAGGQPLTVLAPKTGSRLPVGSDIAISWSPAEARVLGGEPSGAQEEVIR